MKFFAAFIFISLLSFLFFANQVQSQQRIRFKSYESRSGGMQMKGNFFQVKDRLMSPLVYTGGGGQFGIFRVREREMSKDCFHLGVSVNYAQNKFGFNVLYAQPELSYSYSRITNLAYSRSQKILLGFAVSGKPRLYNFLNEDAYHLHWITSYTLDLNAVFEREIGRDRNMWIELQIPVAGMVFRPEDEIFYSIQSSGFREIAERVHTNGNFASLHNFQSATLRTFFDLTGGETGAFSIAYEADFVKYSYPVKTTIITHSMVLRFTLNRIYL